MKAKITLGLAALFPSRTGSQSNAIEEVNANEQQLAPNVQIESEDR